ncbi:hypothetical protein Tco_0421713 [Tanacetum coccineum]
MLKLLQIFQRLHFDISFADALLHMPKFASMFKSLLIDYVVDPRVPLILGRPFLRTARALIDVYVNVKTMLVEEYAQEVLRFLDCLTSGNPTPSDSIIASSSSSFTPFEGGDFIIGRDWRLFYVPEEELFYICDNELQRTWREKFDYLERKEKKIV